MKTARNTLVLAATAVATLAGISAAQAGTIYQDNFARTGDLAGSSPAPIDATSSTWAIIEQSSTEPAPTTTGSAVDFTGVNDLQDAYLPLTLQASSTYAFTLTITPNSGTTGYWMAMGFGNVAGSEAATNTLINNSTTEAWLIYGDNGTTQSFYSGGTSQAAYGGTTTGGTADTFTITLTTPADLATGSAGVSMYDSLGLIGSSLTPRTGSLTAAELANVDAIIIGNQYITGAFSGLTLTGPVPEPASLGLLAVGGLALLLVKRRKMAV